MSKKLHLGVNHSLPNGNSHRFNLENVKPPSSVSNPRPLDSKSILRQLIIIESSFVSGRLVLVRPTWRLVLRHENLLRGILRELSVSVQLLRLGIGRLASSLVTWMISLILSFAPCLLNFQSFSLRKNSGNIVTERYR